MKGIFFYTSGCFMKDLAIYIIDTFEKIICFDKTFQNFKKLQVLNANFRKNARFLRRKKRLDHVFGLI